MGDCNGCTSEIRGFVRGSTDRIIGEIRKVKDGNDRIIDILDDHRKEWKEYKDRILATLEGHGGHAESARVSTMTVREAVVALNALGERYRDVEITCVSRDYDLEISGIMTVKRQTGKNTYRDAVLLLAGE